jgi:outer membrane usher protein
MRRTGPLFILLLFMSGGPVAAGDGAALVRPGIFDADLRTRVQTLLLDVWLNGEPKHLITTVVQTGETSQIDCGDLAQIGIRVPAAECSAGELVDVSKLSGVRVEIDGAEQRLSLHTDSGRLSADKIDLRPRVPDADLGAAGYGMIAEYDIVAAATDIGGAHEARSAGGELSLTVFTPVATLTSNGLARTDDDEPVLRLDTTIDIDDPARLRRWSIGDSISGGLRWSRAIRLGGIRVASDFSLQPGLVTMPLPDFFGDAAVPSNVDVLVGATRVYEGKVDGGPFELHEIPVVSGSGEVTVVLRDALGRETRSTFAAYGSNSLLDGGLAAYAFDAGLIRRNYGRRSFDYGDLAGTATFRYGLTDYLTLEGHSEAVAGTMLGGLGGVLSLSPVGVFDLGGAYSTGTAGEGGLLSLAFESRQKPLTLFGSFAATTPGFADIASREGASTPSQRLQIGGSLSLGDFGHLAASWIDNEYRDQEAVKLASVSYTLSSGSGWFFSATGFYNEVSGTAAGELHLSIPIGDDGRLSGSMRGDRGRLSQRLSYDLAANPDGGTGARVSLTNTGDLITGEAGVIWHGKQVSLTGEVSGSQDQVSARASASGSLVAVDGSTFLAKRSVDSFALVRTGRKDVRVYRENREVASTDADGEALLPGLIAYTGNRISVEASDFPMQAVIEASERLVAPRRRSVAIVDLAPQVRRPLLITVKLPDGSHPPAGTRARFQSAAEDTVVGHHGQVFAADLSIPTQLRLALAGGDCIAAVVPPPPGTTDEIPKAGPLVCRAQAAP